jgi:cation efflux family protein
VTELGSEDGRLPEQLQSEAHAGGHGTKAVVVALLANLGIAVAKFVGYLVTGASSMLAEALHSVADSGNQAMLLAGSRLARRGPDPDHPFGHGRVRYFAAFLVAVVLFTMSCWWSPRSRWTRTCPRTTWPGSSMRPRRGAPGGARTRWPLTCSFWCPWQDSNLQPAV